VRFKPLSRRHPAAGFGVVLAALFITAGAFSAIDTNTSAVQAAVTNDQSVQEGKTLFAEGCSSCHGLNAEGTTDGPSLIGVGAAAVDFQVSSGRMPMATQGVQAPRKQTIYNEEEIAALAAYVASLAPGPAIPTDADTNTVGADVAKGGELFRLNCAQCHNFAGQGGALSNGKYAPNLSKASARQILEAMLTGPQNMPIFSDKTLPKEDKKAIIAYIEELRQDKNPGGLNLGNFGPVTEGLFGWLFGFGVLTGFAIWIGVKAK
jgi:ubiquinol-cytochrome c reductase cytochrome c subunit